MDLFTSEANLQIVKITKLDVISNSDALKLFKIAILKHEAMYPEISLWLKDKVLPGMVNDQRIAYLGLCNNEPAITAVVKIGASSKICHLHIEKEFQDKNIGELFFAMMIINARHSARSIHFTLPESLWESEKQFFSSFGFKKAQKSTTQYRKSEEELSCDSSFEKVWSSTLVKLPKIMETHSLDKDSIVNGLMMSIQPKYINRIMQGDKVIELRKKFDHKWTQRRITLYSTSPTKAILGYAVIQGVLSNTPEKIWEQYGSELGCSQLEYKQYTGGSDKIYAIKLANVTPYSNPIYLSQLSQFLDAKLNPPQSHLSLKENRNWVNAIAISDLLQGKFSTL
ncbi:MAG: GNAT family N-acetyltransferase, partial [Bacteroidia bacterium]